MITREQIEAFKAEARRILDDRAAMERECPGSMDGRPSARASIRAADLDALCDLVLGALRARAANAACSYTLHHMAKDELCRNCGRAAGDHARYIGPEWLASVDAHVESELRGYVQSARDAVLNPGMVRASDVAITQLADRLAEMTKGLAEVTADRDMHRQVGADVGSAAAADIGPVAERLGLVPDWHDVGGLGRLCIERIDDIDGRRAVAEASLMQTMAERDEARSERDEYARGCRNANERLQRALTKAGA